MMRIIPKSTKVKLQFYKDFTLPDVILALIVLLFAVLAVTSNLPQRFYIGIGIISLSVPLFIKSGEGRFYHSIWYLFKFAAVKKHYGKKMQGSNNISNIIPFTGIKDGLITYPSYFSGVIEIQPVEFRLLAKERQDYIIDRVVSNCIKYVSGDQCLDIVKIDKPLILDGYIDSELQKMQGIVSNKESEDITEMEFRKRIEIIEDRLNIIDNINSENKVLCSHYYFIVYDSDEKTLNSTLQNMLQNLSFAGINGHRLNDVELAVFLKYSYGSIFDERNVEKVKPEDYLDYIMPDEIKFNAMNTVSGENSIYHFIVTDYPLKVGNAWGRKIFDIENTKVVMKLKPVDKDKAIKRIDNAIFELQSQSLLSGKASVQIDKAAHLETLNQLLIGLQTDNEILYDVTLIISAYDEKGKNSVRKEVKKRLREDGFRFTDMFGRQHDAFFASEIGQYNKTGISRGIHSSSIAASFPFVSNGIMDEKGFMLGENKYPVFIDFFKRDKDRVNSNMVIIGRPGSGKSYAAKTILSNLTAEDSKIFVLDPENEYGKLAKSLGGKVVDVGAATEGRINPFQIIASLDDEDNGKTNAGYYAHLQFLEEFFRVILPGINQDSMETLNSLLIQMYAEKGIESKTNISKLKPKDFPVFDDFYLTVNIELEKTKDEYARNNLTVISNYINKFASGGRNSNLWNGCTTFSAKENFICFNFQSLLANKNNVTANAQMLLILKYLDNEIIKNRDYNIKHNKSRKIIVVIDEAHTFIDEKYPIALDFMYQLAKRIRKYNGMQIVITQNVKDFTGTPDIARKSSAIINVSQYSLIFSLSPNDMSDLCRLYEKAGEINETEQGDIINNPCGCAFLITSPLSRTNIRIVAPKQIEELFEI